MELLATKRETEYFDKVGLQTLTGLSESAWDKAIFKELMDNALDVLDESGKREIEIEHNDLSFAVYDTGKNFTQEIIKKVYDFSAFYSSKRDSRLPSRGLQGNALKTIIGICYFKGYSLYFQSNKKRYSFEIDETGLSIGRVSFTKKVETVKDPRKGIIIKGNVDIDFDNDILLYALCNADVRIRYNDHVTEPLKETVAKLTTPSIHWFDFEKFMKFAVKHFDNDKKQTTRKFIQNFERTQRLKESDLQYKNLEDYIRNNELESLFYYLKENCTIPKSDILKKYQISKETFIKCFSEENVKKYKIITGEFQYAEASIPYLVECCLVYDPEDYDWNNVKSFINGSVPYQDNAFIINQEIDFRNCTIYPGLTIRELLTEFYYQARKGSTLYINVISPLITITNKSKDVISVDYFLEGFLKAVHGVTKELLDKIDKRMKREEKEEKQDRKAIEKREKEERKNKPSKNKLMKDYFLESVKESAGKYITNVRNVFYIVAKKINTLHGISLKNSDYSNTFSQKIVTYFLDTVDWLEEKLFFDERGTFISPMGEEVKLSTKAVREYIEENRDHEFKYYINCILYIEKEGFNEAFKQSGFIQNKKVGVASAKGYANRACKLLLDFFIKKGVPVYVLTDCDIFGMNIFFNMRDGSKTFKKSLDVTRIGLSIEDIERYNLGDSVERKESIRKYKSIVAHLTEGEKEFFFVKRAEYKGGINVYRRCEINAFKIEELINYLDEKLPDRDLFPPLEHIQYLTGENDLGFDIESIKSDVLMEGLKSESHISFTHKGKELASTEDEEVIKEVASTLIEHDVLVHSFIELEIEKDYSLDEEKTADKIMEGLDRGSNRPWHSQYEGLFKEIRDKREIAIHEDLKRLYNDSL